MSLRPAGLTRRLAAFIYEGVLLFGVVVMAAYLYGTLTQQRHALQGRTGLQLFLFVILGIYFVWFWSQGRQTVAQKAWRLRLLRRDGRPLSQALALLRYVLAYIWFAPALLIAHHMAHLTGPTFTVLLLGGIAIYAVFARLLPGGQFLHDVLCRTQIVDTTNP